MVLCSYPDSHLIYPPQSKLSADPKRPRITKSPHHTKILIVPTCNVTVLKYLSICEKIIKSIEKYSDRIGLSVDVALDKNGVRVEESIDVLNKNRHSDLPILDIGLETIVKFSREIRTAGAVIMNGPAGVFEREAFTLGTVELIDAATKSGFSVIGGGHSAAVVEQLGVESRIDHISRVEVPVSTL